MTQKDASGPNDERRPADSIGTVVMVGRIATGEIEEVERNAICIARGKKNGLARVAKPTPVQRAEIAKVATQARLKKS